MKNYLFLFWFGILSFVFACKNDKSIDIISKNADTIDNGQSGTPISKLIDPCSLISLEELGQTFNVDPQQISIKNDQYSGDFSRSCNLRWNDTDNGNELNVQIILQANPIPGEIDDWADSYLTSKLQSGEKSFPDIGSVIKYVKYEGIQNLSAFNEENNRLYWKISKDFVMAVFLSDNFNDDLSDKYLSDLCNVLTKNGEVKLK